MAPVAAHADGQTQARLGEKTYVRHLLCQWGAVHCMATELNVEVPGRQTSNPH